MNKDLNYYLNLPWSYRFEWDNDDQFYVTSVIEIPGCKSHGKTIEEASKMIKEALECCLALMLEHDDKITEPPKISDFKGNIPLRTTPDKHYKLVQRANATGKSINKLIDEAIDKLLAS